MEMRAEVAFEIRKVST